MGGKQRKMGSRMREPTNQHRHIVTVGQSRQASLAGSLFHRRAAALKNPSPPRGDESAPAGLTTANIITSGIDYSAKHAFLFLTKGGGWGEREKKSFPPAIGTSPRSD